jgi:hypothetical protein
MELEITEIDDKLAGFRLQVAEEKNEPRNKMSDAALAKLRAIKDQDRVEVIDGERLKTALLCVVPTVKNLERLVVNTRLSTPVLDYAKVKVTTGDLAARMALKLGWWIAAGYKLGREIDSVSRLNFFSELTLSELQMTDRQFAADWDAESAKKRLQARVNRGIITVEDVSEAQSSAIRLYLCGYKNCSEGENRTRGRVPVKGEGCSKKCRQAMKIIKKRTAVVHSVSEPPVLSRPA